VVETSVIFSWFRTKTPDTSSRYSNPATCKQKLTVETIKKPKPRFRESTQTLDPVGQPAMLFGNFRIINI